MALPNIFSPEVVAEIAARIDKLTPATPANWGKMTVAQMLAHCNVTYEMVYETKHPKPNAFVRFILKMMIKGKVVSEEGYPQNGSTAPQFVIKETKDFEVEKRRLMSYINQTQVLGGAHFEGKESHSFGKLTETEWNNMFYKHLNHHLTQFGV